METLNSIKTELVALNLSQLEDFIEKIGESKFRAKQLHYWIYKKSANSFDEMTNLSKTFREKLKEIAVISNTKIAQRQISKDGTIKYLLEFEDGKKVETVLMRFDNRPNLTACVSCQVGCAVNCAFCATGRGGFSRNLTTKEIVDQVLTIQRDTGLNITNIVYMGQGEPFLNYENVLNSINVINSEMEIGNRRITISTSGIVPKIKQLAQENRQLTLALSLHAPNHELRAQIMPIENKYSIDEVIDAVKYLTDITGRRATIEYVLINKLNDTPECARQLAHLIKNLKCNVNLIPYNTLDKNDKFQKPSTKRVNEFRYILEQSDKKVTIRLERGADIDAACGQLNG
ncbi:MAG: 23S rRNA (adenine(2503)-C(2))-methyltransferase RlmN, partial [Candidatus Gastranaerophilales bacterium]|nr:23S rRNA (adenine(2503)-C(2))-methyltransferase RlmN [Candidatus Gastranaerophilales bacterium]